MTKILTPRQTAEYLGINVATLAQWRFHERVDLKYIRLNGSNLIRYREDDVEQFLQAQTHSGRPGPSRSLAPRRKRSRAK